MPHSKEFLIENFRLVVEVIDRYYGFLQEISRSLVFQRGDVEVNNRKFESVKRELSNFIVGHKRFFKYLEVTCGYGVNQEVLTLDELSEPNNIMKDALMRLSVVYPDIPLDPVFQYSSNLEEIKKKIKSDKKCRTVNDRHIKEFFNNNFLCQSDVDYCWTYLELREKTEDRVFNYLDNLVSSERIFNFTFVLKGLNIDRVNEEKCPVCLEEYVVGQELCKFPCTEREGHFCCKCCTEEMFEPSKRNSRCPICRADLS